MAIEQSRKYARLVIPLGLAACLIGGYWFYWSQIAHRIEEQVRTVLPANAASDISVTGFPYRLTLEVKNLNLKTDNDVAFTAASVSATSTPFNPLLWVLEGAEDPALRLPDGTSKPLKATALKASLRFNQTGFERFSLTFDALETTGLDGWQVGPGLFHIMSALERDNSLATVIDLRAIQIKKPLEGPAMILGQTIDRVRIAGPISEGRALMKSSSAWQQAGGKLTVMAGEIIWGPVTLANGTGSLFLSQSGKWQGSLAGQGALKPEGMSVPGLSGPVRAEIIDGQISLAGLPGIDISNAFK